MNDNETHYDQFNLLIPCYFAFSFDDNPQKCRINLQVKKGFFDLKLFKYDTFQNIEVHIDKWKFIRVQDSIVSFFKENNAIDLFLFFINDSINFKRLLFSLAEAGLIIPKISPDFNENDFLFISNPSFIPTCCYSYSTKLNILSQVKNVTQSQLIIILERETIPFNKDFIDLVMPFEIKETDRQIEENNAYHHKIWEKMKENDCGNILDFFFKKIKMDNSSIEVTHKLLIQCQSDPVSTDPEIERNIHDIEKDQVRMISDSESKKWSEKLCSICSMVCKMHVLKSGIKFVQGQFEVAKRIALLMNGESFVPGDNSELPDKYKNLFNYNDNADINSNFDFLKYFFAFYEYLFESFENKDQSKNIELYVYKVSKDVLNVFKRFLPKVAPYFIVHKMNTFLFYNQFYATIFCRTIKNIWPVWILLKMMRDQEKAYASLSAAILYAALPIFLEKKVKDEDHLKEIDPSEFDLDNKIEELVKISTFLYRCKDVDLPDD